MNIEDLSIVELREKYLSKELSPVEVVKNQFELIRKNKELNAVVTEMEESALQEARDSEARYNTGKSLGEMDGIPYVAKDIFFTKGVRTTMASRVYENFIPSISASIVERLAGVGAILMGKSNTHEFACGAMSDRSIFGACHNPRNTEHVPGGSSGGSGASLAAHLVPAAIGSDTTGSVRLPSCACGVVGMKPTQGRVSKYGVYPLSDSLDHVGPMTRSVLDNATMLNYMAGYDPLDKMSLNLPYTDFRSEIGKDIKGMRIAVPYAMFADSVDKTVLSSTENAISALKELGAVIEEIPDFDADKKYANATKMIRICEAHTLHRANVEKVPELYHPEVLSQMISGGEFKAWQYIEALQLRDEFKKLFSSIMKDYDLMITPTMSMLPPIIETREMELNGVKTDVNAQFNRFTLIGSGNGYPALSLPIGFDKDNLPTGLQFCSDIYQETKVYRAAYQLEKELALKI